MSYSIISILIGMLFYDFVSLIQNSGNRGIKVIDTENFLDTHRNVIDGLEYYLINEKQRLYVLEKQLNLFKEEQGKMDNDPNYFGNPINAFTFVKRLTADLNFIEKVTKSLTEFIMKSGMQYPTEENLKEAANGLARLQKVYALRISDLGRGVVYGTFSHGNKPFAEQSLPLSASDCFEIGRVLHDSRDFTSAADWLFEALHKYRDKEEDDVYPISDLDITNLISSAGFQLDNYKDHLHTSRIRSTLKYREYLIRRNLESIAQEQFPFPYIMHSDDNTVEVSGIRVPHVDYVKLRTLSYEALCRGEIPFPDYKSKRLTCYYTSGPHPFLKLARIKTEQLYRSPDILLFPDIISDEEINTLKLNKSELRRATISGGQNQQVYIEGRICKTGWLKNTDPKVARISRRVSHFTGLSVESAEELQIANYGTGEYFMEHCDFLGMYSNPIFGERIASVIFYMSDVEQGGATVFVNIKRTVFPIKNAAIFWMNLHPSGEPDYATMHAGCPILRGSKWIGVKWLRTVGQEFLRPCTNNNI